MLTGGTLALFWGLIAVIGALGAAAFVVGFRSVQ